MAVVTSSQRSWQGEVDKAEKDRYKDEDGYEFSNSRKFKSSDKSNSGIYEK